jgi:hypothetical protein
LAFIIPIIFADADQVRNWSAKVALYAAIFASMIFLGGLLRVSHQYWHDRGYARMRRRFAAASAWFWPESPDRSDDSSSREVGDQLGLGVGLVLSALDVVLTTLLLRDVFPENPYPMPWLDRLLPGAGTWAFYATVAAFKTGIEIWLGLVQGRLAGFNAGRWFVLGMACIFDAALALVRGQMLAEQGLGGAMVTASNVLYLGFGLAIPWIAAHTGALLGQLPGRRLQDLGLVAWLVDGIGRMLRTILGIAWIAFSIPIVMATLAWIALASIWLALEETVAMVWGDGPANTVSVVVDLDDEASTRSDAERSPEQSLVEQARWRARIGQLQEQAQ